MKIKERCVAEKYCPKEAPRLFIQNAMVDHYNETVYKAAMGTKYDIKEQDSVIGTNSAELGEKVMNQIPHIPLKNTKQLAIKLRIGEGERTEIAMNVRTDDGLNKWC